MSTPKEDALETIENARKYVEDKGAEAVLVILKNTTSDGKIVVSSAWSSVGIYEFSGMVAVAKAQFDRMLAKTEADANTKN